MPGTVAAMSKLPLTPQHVPAIVPVLLGIVAGFVDAVTFLGLFGFFVAQVTGSYVFVGAGVVAPGALGVTALLAVPVFFLSGVAAVMVAAAASAAGARPLVWTMLLECVLLAAMVAASLLGAPFAAEEEPWAIATALIGLATMGAQATQVRALMQGVPSTNVMTANTAQLAVDLVQAIFARGEATAPFYGRLIATLRVMAGFLAGTIAGALMFAALGFVALIAPLAVLAALAIWAMMSAQ